MRRLGIWAAFVALCSLVFVSVGSAGKPCKPHGSCSPDTATTTTTSPTSTTPAAGIPAAPATPTAATTAALSVPSAPKGLTVTSTTSTSASVTWTANPTGDQVTSYQVYYQKPDWSGTTVTVYNVTGTSYTITGLSAGTSYGIRVSAHNSAGYGPWNDPAVVGTTSAATSTSTAPTETGRWYAYTSPWNTPIPTNPQLAPDNASMISKLTGLYNRPWIGPTSSSTPSIAYAGATTPNVTVQVNYPSCNAKTMQIPIPAGTKVEQVNESHLVVVGTDGTEWDMFKVTPPNVTPLSSGPVCSTTSTWAATVVGLRGPATGWQSNADTGPSYRGSNTAAGAGTIRKRDLQVANGAAWDHALALAYPATANGGTTGHPKSVYPATSGDGTTTGTGAIPEGGRIQLDPSINCDTWPSLVNAPAWKRSECKTLQKYGAIVVDTGAGLYLEWYKDTGADWATGLNGFSWSDSYLPQDLHSHFRVLAWNWHWAGGNP